MPDIAVQYSTERKKRGISHREAAPLIGVSFSTLARLEREGGEPTPKVKRRLVAWISGKPMEVNTGWICPRCAKVNAPSQAQCTC